MPASNNCQGSSRVSVSKHCRSQGKLPPRDRTGKFTKKKPVKGKTTRAKKKSRAKRPKGAIKKLGEALSSGVQPSLFG